MEHTLWGRSVEVEHTVLGGVSKTAGLSVLRLETIQSDSVGILYVIQNLYLVTSGA